MLLVGIDLRRRAEAGVPLSPGRKEPMPEDALGCEYQLRTTALCTRAMAPNLAEWAERVPNGAALGILRDNEVHVKLFSSFPQAVAFRASLPEIEQGASPVIPLQRKITLCISRPDSGKNGP